jgi:hypothetical protein
MYGAFLHCKMPLPQEKDRIEQVARVRGCEGARYLRRTQPRSFSIPAQPPKKEPRRGLPSRSAVFVDQRPGEVRLE